MTATIAIVVTLAFAAPPTTAQQSAASGAEGIVDAERSFDATITTAELFEKAREATGLDRHRLAEEFYQEILIREPANVRAMLELADSYERIGKLEYARGLLDRAAALEPENRDIETKLESVESVLVMVVGPEVDSLMQSGRYELAIPKLSLLISIRPGSADLRYKKAVCYYEMGRLDAALANLDDASRIDPDEKFYELRHSILESIEASETRQLAGEATPPARSRAPVERGRSIQVSGGLIQIFPENEWNRGLNEDSSAVYRAQTGTHDNTPKNAAGSSVMTRLTRRGAALLERHLGSILVALALLLLFRSPLVPLIAKAFSRRPALSGRFDTFGLAEILLMLNAENHTGVLTVHGRRRGRIYVEKGEPRHASVGNLEGMEAMTYLFSHSANGGFAYESDTKSLTRTIDTPLSVLLMDLTNRRRPLSEEDPARDRFTGEEKACCAAGAPAKKTRSRMKELLDAKVKS